MRLRSARNLLFLAGESQDKNVDKYRSKNWPLVDVHQSIRTSEEERLTPSAEGLKEPGQAPLRDLFYNRFTTSIQGRLFTCHQFVFHARQFS